MRVSYLFAGFVTAGLIGCGGSEHHVIIDANTIDSPPDAFVCDLPASTTGKLTLDDGAGGPKAFPGTFTAATATPPNALAFALNGILSPDPPRQDLFMIWINTVGMFATAGSEGVMTGPPKSGAAATQNIDTDDKCGGCLDGFTGYELASGGGVDLMTATQVYQVDQNAPGTLQFDTWDKAAGQNVMNVHVAGSYKNVSFIGFDPVSGEPNNCTATFAELDFNFLLSWTTPTLQQGPRKIKHIAGTDIDVTDVPSAQFRQVEN